MKTAAQYLDDIRIKHGLTSDYQIKKMTGWSSARLSIWRNGRSHFDDEAAMIVAGLLEIDPSEVLINAHMSRSVPQALPIWQGMIDRLCTVAGTLVIATGMAAAPAPAEAASTSNAANNSYTLCAVPIWV